MMTVISDWRDLPFDQINVVDTEFYPGSGLANGGREGDRPTPLCIVVHEMRSGRVTRLWQDELGRFPPYRLDAGALFIGFMNSAEFGFHIAQGWGQPACSVDPYVEYRHLMNDGSVKAVDRPKGFYSLDGALRHFGVDAIDTAHKKDMTSRIIQGPPFSAQERADILDYCQNDVEALARLVPFIVPTIKSLPDAMHRSSYMWAVAQQEWRGIPLDTPALERTLRHWDDIKLDLVTEMDRPFGVYEIRDGAPHWVKENFKACTRRRGIVWPSYADGTLDETAGTFKDMCRAHPEMEPLRELKAMMSKMRLSDFQVGCDGRNRTLLSPFGSKSGRNQPSASRYIFGPAKWYRFFISPPPGLALVHRDYSQQEVCIAAVLSGDEALLAACATGDVYLGIAKQLGFAPEDADADSHPQVRLLFKTVVLGILYGLQARSLAARTNISLFEAAEILARLRARFRRFEEFAARVGDQAGLLLEIRTGLGWTLHTPPGTNSRLVRNFPCQATGADILHIASILAERRGIRIIAPVHDAIMAEGEVDQIADVSVELDKVMRDASRIPLRGFELKTDFQVIRPGERYQDKRGLEMWTTVNGLVTKLERERVAQ
jgi:hypothetical protein